MANYEKKRALLRPNAPEDPAEPAARSGYLVVHQSGDRVAVLARIPTAVAHPAELDRFAVPLQAAGQTTGRVVLIERRSGRVVAQRSVSSPVRAWRWRARSSPRPVSRLSVPPSPPASGAANQDGLDD